MGRENWAVGQQVILLASGWTYSPSPIHCLRTPLRWPTSCNWRVGYKRSLSEYCTTHDGWNTTSTPPPVTVFSANISQLPQCPGFYLPYFLPISRLPRRYKLSSNYKPQKVVRRYEISKMDKITIYCALIYPNQSFMSRSTVGMVLY